MALVPCPESGPVTEWSRSSDSIRIYLRIHGLWNMVSPAPSRPVMATAAPSLRMSKDIIFNNSVIALYLRRLSLAFLAFLRTKPADQKTVNCIFKLVKV